MLGTIALVYFFTLFQSYSGLETAQMTPSSFAKSANRNNSPTVTDPSLSQALVRMRSEIDLLKGSIEASNKENSALKAHIKTLESAFGPSTASLPPQSEKPVPSTIREEAVSSSAPAPKVVTIVLDMPTTGFADDFHEAPLPIAGQDAPKRTLFAVELASGIKADALDARWGELKRRHPKLLDKLQPRSIKTNSGTQGSAESHKLVVGPFKNAAAAARLCARLNAAGAKCEGTVFSGTPLGNIAAR
jgi:hypothetical protein